MSDSLQSPWDSPGKGTGVGCHFFLQRIFLTQGSNPGLPALQADALPSLGILYKYINYQKKKQQLILVISSSYSLYFCKKVSIIESSLKFEYLDKIVFNDMGKGT